MINHNQPLGASIISQDNPPNKNKHANTISINHHLEPMAIDYHRAHHDTADLNQVRNEGERVVIGRVVKGGAAERSGNLHPGGG